MTTFIFYTDEGYTIAPNNEELDNLLKFPTPSYQLFE